MEGVTPIELWGKDHWSTLAYIETRIVDYSGVLDERHLRGGDSVHQDGRRPARYPTRLSGEEMTRPGHDDFDCIGDMIALGLLDTDGMSGADARTMCADLDFDMGDLVETMVGNDHAFSFTPVGTRFGRAS